MGKVTRGRLKKPRTIEVPKGAQVGSFSELLDLLIGTRAIQAFENGAEVVYWKMTIYNHELEGVLRKDAGTGPEVATLPRRL
jgi:hypothetical protein